MKRLRARALPHVVSSPEWATGYWTGIAVGLVLGVALCVIVFKGVR